MTVACYVRVSTEDQNLDRQLNRTSDYAQESLGADLDSIKAYRDKSTGTNTDRSGYRDMMADAEAGEIDAVVVHSVSRISRSIADLERTASKLEECDVELHIVSESLKFIGDENDPFQKALFHILGTFAELEADLAQQRTREGIAARMESDDYHHGPAPLGYVKDDGQLIESGDYHDVCAVLEMVQKDNLSKRKAADRLDCARSTVGRALERPELYGL